MARSMLIGRFLVILGCLLMLLGCRQKNEQQTSDQAAEAATSLPQIRSELNKTKRQLADLKEELQAVKDIRDELDMQVTQITAERDNAVKTAAAAEGKIKDLTDQLSDLPDNLNSLENELNERNKLIESLQITINELQAAMTEQQAIITEQENTIATLEKIIQEQITAEDQTQQTEQEEILEPEPEV